MTQQSKTAFKDWADYYRQASASGEALAYPSETLVRLFKGKYITGMPRDFHGLSVLDVGCGGANNALMMARMGLRVFGTEVDESLCREARDILASQGFEADFRVGTNTRLPFDDDQFDFLVSWNVLHYENTEPDIVAGLQEYARVLKPGGRLLLSTTGPDHAILKNARTLGGHRYQIGREDDFRKGEIYFYFDSPAYIHFYFDPVFHQVQVGRTHDRLFNDTLDWFIVTAVK